MEKIIKTRNVFSFAWVPIKILTQLVILSIFKRRNLGLFSERFASLYCYLFDVGDHSISNRGFALPTALGTGPSNRANHLLAQLYGGKYACLSYGGSSGAALTMLIGVLPKLHPKRKLILYDSMSHQSSIGGILFARFKAVPISRSIVKKHGTAKPITLKDVQEKVEKYGAENICALWLVVPTYDGFISQSENIKIFKYMKERNIIVIIDGAWAATIFANQSDVKPLLSYSDILITSTHKRGITTQSLGAVIFNRRDIALLWDAANELGFRSSSVSFVETMIAEHRLRKVVQGDWNDRFKKAESAAIQIRERIKEVHDDIYVVTHEQVSADISDVAHILISTTKIDIDARCWAENLSKYYALDIEKATSATLLMLCASPISQTIIDQTLTTMRASLVMTINKKLKEKNHGHV